MNKAKSIIKKRKVVIIGAGHVGSHAGYALASQGLVEEIIYIDKNENKAFSQSLDIYDSTVYLPNRISIKAGNYSDLNDADMLIICVGIVPDLNKNEKIIDTLKLNIKDLKEVIDNIKKTEFKGIIINISNPADIATHYIQEKLDYDHKKVISTSTVLDSARLKRAISEAISIDQNSIYAYVIGEHSGMQVIPWSSVTVGGKSLLKLIESNKEKYKYINLEELENKAKKSCWDILTGKGSTEFGIGAALAEVARSILCDEHKVLPVSVYLNGEYGQKNVYASVPAVLGNNVVEEIIELSLNEKEKKLFSDSCNFMKENYELALKI